MKKLQMLTLAALTLVLFLAVGCEEEQQANAWIFDAGQDIIGFRLGVPVTENNEVGISTLLWTGNSQHDMDIVAYGLYGLHHFPYETEFRNPLIADFLPETLTGRLYIGAKLDVNQYTNESAVAPVAGIVFEDILFLEYQFESFNEDAGATSSQVVFGIHIPF